jgi:hypothetical protein
MRSVSGPQSLGHAQHTTSHKLSSSASAGNNNKNNKISLPHFHEIEAAVAAEHAALGAERGLGLMEMGGDRVVFAQR